ncbi:hypothetical protein [Ferruginibacter profundus]
MDKNSGVFIIIRQVSLNGLLSSYIIQGVQITNSLGAIIATLTENKLSGSMGNSISSHQRMGNFTLIR